MSHNMPLNDFSLLHYDPYAFGAEEFYYLDERSAQTAIDFIETQLTFTKGKWLNQPFKLAPFQRQLVACLFGWKFKTSHLRRYNDVFVYVPRKNGKSELVSAIAETVFFCDGEPNAEIYVAAKTLDQATTLYKMMETMIRQNQYLYNEVKITESKKTITSDYDDSFIKAIASDAQSAHSTSPHVGIIDELHTQPNYKLVEAIGSGRGAREQAILFKISTAAELGENVCNDELDYALAVRDGRVKDLRYLPVLFFADKDDDWTNPVIWAKANPNYPNTPNHEFLKSECLKGQYLKSHEISFKRLYLNIQVSAINQWLDLDAWENCLQSFDTAELKANDCFVSFDLASRNDLTCMLLFFPKTHHIIPFFYIPQSALENDKSGHYEEWVEDGFMIVAGENSTDYRVMIADYLRLQSEFNILGTAFDPFNSSQFIVELQDVTSLEITEYRQNMANFNEPSKLCEVMVKDGEFICNNDVMSWNVANCHIRMDNNENIMPCKKTKSSPLKIDGVVCLIMCLGMHLNYTKEQQLEKSIYEERGIRSV